MSIRIAATRTEFGFCGIQRSRLEGRNVSDRRLCAHIGAAATRIEIAIAAVSSMRQDGPGTGLVVGIIARQHISYVLQDSVPKVAHRVVENIPEL